MNPQKPFLELSSFLEAGFSGESVPAFLAAPTAARQETLLPSQTSLRSDVDQTAFEIVSPSTGIAGTESEGFLSSDWLRVLFIVIVIAIIFVSIGSFIWSRLALRSVRIDASKPIRGEFVKRGRPGQAAPQNSPSDPRSTVESRETSTVNSDSGEDRTDAEIDKVKLLDEDLQSLFHTETVDLLPDADEVSSNVVSTSDTDQRSTTTKLSFSPVTAESSSNSLRQSSPTESDLKRKISRLEKENADLQIELLKNRNALNEIAQAPARPSDASNQVESLKRTVHELRTNLETATQERKTFSEELASMKSQLDSSRADESDLRRELEQLQDCQNKLHNENLISSTQAQRLPELEKKLSEAHAATAEARNQLEAVQEKLAQLVAERQTLAEEKALVESNLLEQERILQEAEADRVASETELAELRVQLDQLQTQYKTVLDSQVVTLSKLVEVEQSRDAASQCASQLEQKLKESTSQSQELENENTMLNAQITELQSQLESSDANLQILRQEFDQERHERAELENRLRVIEEENSQLSSSVSTARSELLLANPKVVPTLPGSGLPGAGVSREAKAKFTKLFRAYQKERTMRQEIEQLLTQAEEQIDLMRNKLRDLQQKTV